MTWDREQRVGVIGDVHHDGTPSFGRISGPGNCSTRPVRMRIVSSAGPRGDALVGLGRSGTGPEMTSEHCETADLKRVASIERQQFGFLRSAERYRSAVISVLSYEQRSSAN
jgi:hypothetical protein